MSLVRVRFKKSGLKCLGPRRDVEVVKGHIYSIDDKQLARHTADSYEIVDALEPEVDALNTVQALLDADQIDEETAETMRASITAEREAAAAMDDPEDETDDDPGDDSTEKPEGGTGEEGETQDGTEGGGDPETPPSEATPGEGEGGEEGDQTEPDETDEETPADEALTDDDEEEETPPASPAKKAASKKAAKKGGSKKG